MNDGINTLYNKKYTGQNRIKISPPRIVLLQNMVHNTAISGLTEALQPMP